MQNSFRWYGPNDPVSLSDIRQSNAEYLVTSLHQIPYGEKWTKNDVKKRIDFITKHNKSNNINLKWNVVIDKFFIIFMSKLDVIMNRNTLNNIPF